MTTLENAARQALDALEDIFGKEKKDVGAINALRQALEQPKRKPVTWMYSDAEGNNPVPLYTEPPTREWVGLTDVEITDVANTAETYTESVKLTEAALKELNT